MLICIFSLVGINILCKIPFNDDIAEGCDNGRPILISKPNSRQADAYKRLGKNVAEFLHERLLKVT